MSERVMPARAIVAAGLGVGVLGDQMLRASAGPGLNFFVLFVALAGAIWVVNQAGGPSLGKEGRIWIGVGLMCAAALMWRGSGLVRFMTLVAACTAFALPALMAGRAWVRRAGVLDVIESVVASGLHAMFGGIRLVSRDNWSDTGRGDSVGTARRVGRTALIGVALATLPLIVFGTLFISADAVFATIVADIVSFDLKALLGHALAVVALAWLVSGYLVGMSSGSRLDALRKLDPVKPRLAVAEVATALALVDLLFAGFVAVQLRYLFGGASWVEVTPGLTYAEYARAGFFQLVVAVGLAIPWLLAAHALLGDRAFKARAMFRAFGGAQLLLLFAVVASAIQRMTVYQRVYGLTEERIVVMAILVWLAVVLAWFGVTVLQGRRDRFAFGGLVSAFGLIAALQLMDPAGMAARENLARADTIELDAAHLATLGPDAVPTVLAHIDELSPPHQCIVATQMLWRWGPDRPAEWKAFNMSESRARQAVEARLDKLTTATTDPYCGRTR